MRFYQLELFYRPILLLILVWWLVTVHIHTHACITGTVQFCNTSMYILYLATTIICNLMLSTYSCVTSWQLKQLFPWDNLHRSDNKTWFELALCLHFCHFNLWPSGSPLLLGSTYFHSSSCRQNSWHSCLMHMYSNMHCECSKTSKQRTHFFLEVQNVSELYPI